MCDICNTTRPHSHLPTLADATLALRQANESTERALALLDEAQAEVKRLNRKLDNFREGYARLERDLVRARADHNDEVARLQEDA